jgi:hypothetical protein
MNAGVVLFCNGLDIIFPGVHQTYSSEGLYHYLRYSYANIRNNYYINRFDVGYGISFSNLEYPEKNKDKHDTLFVDYQKGSFGMGLSLSAGFAIGSYYHIGLLYQPTLINISTKQQVDYQHFVSFELLWRIPVVKGKLK